MKVAILNVQAPFVRGGAEYLADSLAGKIRGRGHEVEIIKIPFKWYPAEAVADHMLACRLVDLRAAEPDLAIALKFPAYLIPWDYKKIWLLHQFRQVYEQWGTPYSGMPDVPETRSLREMVRQADNKCLSDTAGLYTNSKIVAGRLKRFNGIEADEVLYPPLDQPELFGPGEYGRYFFYPSRLNAAKRQHLAIEAMAQVRGDFSLVLAGKADSDDYGRQLQELVARLGLEERVKFLGWISEEEKARWMAGARAAVYLPYDEDSYGYVTLEAFHSHKALVTLTDSGGTNELVTDARNGAVVEPTVDALAGAMQRLADDEELARTLGAAAHATLAEHRIEWDHILDTLLAL